MHLTSSRGNAGDDIRVLKFRDNRQFAFTSNELLLIRAALTIPIAE